MLEPVSVLKVADSVLGWFGLLRKEQQALKNAERRAVKALYVALNETVLYFRRLQRPHFVRSKRDKAKLDRNLETEEALSRLWMDAAAELRGVNRDLSERCFLKAQYWADRDRWTDEKVKEANISLNKVLSDARKLIRG